jgi:hypothetical protein
LHVDCGAYKYSDSFTGVTHTYAHTLAVSLEQSSSKICSIELTPSDITLSDIQATVQTQQAPLAIVVQQVHARIGAQKRRGFELEGPPPQINTKPSLSVKVKLVATLKTP